MCRCVFASSSGLKLPSLSSGSARALAVIPPSACEMIAFAVLLLISGSNICVFGS